MVDTSVISDVLRSGVTVAVKIAAPMLLISMAIGIIVAVFQAVTQIHEQTLSFALKLIVVIIVLVIGGGWMLESLQEYMRSIFALIVG